MLSLYIRICRKYYASRGVIMDENNVNIGQLIKDSCIDVNSVDVDKIISNTEDRDKDILVNRIIKKIDSPKDLILVIDDDHSQLKSIKKLLGDHYDLILCDKGIPAIDLFNREHDKIMSILLDLRLPDLDGFEVFERIKELNNNVPIILITGYQKTYGDGFELYKQYRPHGYIVKNHENETTMIFDTLRSSVVMYKKLKDIEKAKEMEIRSRTMAGLLHDLKNLFIPITYAPDIIIDTIKKNDLVQALFYAEMMKHTTLIFNANQELMFNFARGEKMVLRPNYFNIADLVNELINIINTQYCGSLDFKTIFSYQKEFYTDKTILIYQVLYNIVKNSYDALLSTDRRGVVKIEVYPYPEYKTVYADNALFDRKNEADMVIVVADNGPGMPEEMIDKIFDPYFTYGKADGNGLGAWMIKNGITDMLQGELVLDNKPGEGLAYHICLPAKEV